MKRILASLILLVLMASASAANLCPGAIVDEVGALNPEKSAQLQSAVDALVRDGVDVRVRVLAGLKGEPSLEALKDKLLKNCSSWRSSNGGMKNNFLTLFLVPPNKSEKGKTALFYGDALRSRFDSKQLSVQSDMNAMFRDAKYSEGIIAGLSDLADLKEVKLSQATAPLVINHPADNSKGWNVLGWVVGLLAFAGAVWFAFAVFRNREARRGAQRNALAEQGRVTAAVNGFETPYAVTRSRIAKSSLSDAQKATLTDRLAGIKSQFDTACSYTESLNRSKNDPNTPRLSVEEYNDIGASYKKMANILEQLIAERDAVARDIDKPETAAASAASSAPQSKQPAPRNKTHASGHGHFPGSLREPAPAPQQQQASSPIVAQQSSQVIRETVVVHDNSTSLTDLLIADAILHDHHHRDSPTVVVVNNDGSAPSTHHRAPAPVDNDAGADGGSETSFGKSSSGGGSETSFGTSSSGGGGESNWSAPDFGSQTREEKTETPTQPADRDCTRDCVSDCKSSDCASSDCTRADCDCSGGGDD